MQREPEALKAMGEAAMAYVKAHKQPPHRIIGPAASPAERDYLHRWHLLRDQEGQGNIYLHRFHRSDDDRALHDHPWPWTTVVLAGSYREHTETGAFDRVPGTVVSRTATELHRVELLSDTVWTLFLTGPKQREWGFMVPDVGWMTWWQYLGVR